MASTDIDGWTASGFEGVRDAFVKNFDKGLEIGAAFSAYHRGEKVVDLWGGVADADTGRPWDERTLALVFSTTKGATAICANKLAQEGELDVDAPVAKYWPEFAAGGKEDDPGDVLVVAPGRPGVGRRRDDARGSAVVGTGRRGARAPGAALGTRHAARLPRDDLWLAGRRGHPAGHRQERRHVLPTTRSPNHSVLDFWIGLPEGGGTARRHAASVASPIPRSTDDPQIARPRQPDHGPRHDAGQGAVRARQVCSPGRDVWNSRAVHAAEIPAADGIGDARSLARMYAACIGEVDGVRLLDDAQLRERRPSRRGPEQGAARHGHPVRSRLHAALRAHAARRPDARSATSAQVAPWAGPIPMPGLRSAT